MVVARRGYLLPAPLVAEIDRALERMSQKELARLLCCTPRVIDKLRGGVLNPRETGLPSIEKADRLLVRLGLRVAEVYGELYQMPGLEHDWRGGECESCGEHLQSPARLCGFCEAIA